MNKCAKCGINRYSKYCSIKACRICCNDILCNKHGPNNMKTVCSELANVLPSDIISNIINYINKKVVCFECFSNYEDVECMFCYSCLCNKCKKSYEDYDMCPKCYNENMHNMHH